MKVFHFALVASVAFLSASAAMADCAADSRNQRALYSVATTPRQDVRSGLEASGSGPADSAIADPRSIEGTKPGTKVVSELLATSGKSQATLKLSNTYHLAVQCLNNGEVWRAKSSLWSLALSAPINKSADAPTDIIGSRGLPGDFAAEFSLSEFVVTNKIDFEGLETIAKRVHERCMHDPDPKRDCDVEVRDLVKKYDRPSLASWDGAMGTTSVETYGLAASIGYGKFQFRDPVTFAKGDLSTTPWSAQVFAGFMPGDSWPLITLSVSYDRKYKAADTTTKCPAGPGPVLSCETGAFAPPTMKEELPIGLEFRRGFSLCKADQEKPADADNPEEADAACGPFGLTALGLDLKFTYDTKSDGYGFDLPISFVADDKGNLIGGLRFAWDSSDHEFVAGLFVGTAFSVF